MKDLIKVNNYFFFLDEKFYNISRVNGYLKKMGALDNLLKCSCGEEFKIGEKFCSRCGKARFGLKKISDYDPKSSISETCPFCGKKMKEGFIYSREQMVWKELGLDWFTETSKINNEASKFHLFAGNELKAYRCSECRHISINY